MDKDLKSINIFLLQHHVMSLATLGENEHSVCSLFYTYLEDETCFLFASKDDTNHIRHIKQNENVAGNILLETKKLYKIQGVQFKGKVKLAEDIYKKIYYEKFPNARLIPSTIYKININYFKMTDNTLGFGGKIIWKLH